MVSFPYLVLALAVLYALTRWALNLRRGLLPHIAAARVRPTSALVAERLRRLQAFESWFDEPGEDLIEKLADLPPLADLPDAQAWLAVSMRPDFAALWSQLSQSSGTARTDDDLLGLADELSLRALPSALPSADGDGLRAVLERAIRGAEAGRDPSPAYRFLAEHGAALPAVARYSLSWRLANATGDDEEAARLLERAATADVDDPLPAPARHAWEQLTEIWSRSWRPAERAADRDWRAGMRAPSLPSRPAAPAPFDQRLHTLSDTLQHLAQRVVELRLPSGEVVQVVAGEALDTTQLTRLAEPFVLAARPPAGAGPLLWQQLLDRLTADDLGRVGPSAAVVVLNLLRVELDDPTSVVGEQVGADLFSAHWDLLAALPEPGRRAVELLRCVSCYSRCSLAKEAAESRLCDWLMQPREGGELMIFHRHGAPFLIDVAGRRDEAPRLIERWLRQVWLHEDEAESAAAGSLRVALHRVATSPRPPAIWALHPPSGPDLALVQKATELVLLDSLQRARERAGQRYRAATEQALRDWALRAAEPA